MLRIEPRGTNERERLRKAIGLKPSREVRVRCARGCSLARVAATAEGALFMSSPWQIAGDLPIEVVEDGRRLSRRATVRAALTDAETGESIHMTETHSTLAILGDDAEDVDLLVRCQHGDAVIDSVQARLWLRDGRAPRVPTAMPRRPYESLEPWGTETTTVTVTRTIKGDPMPVADMRKWLGWD